jgi:hypothetical protein
VLLITDKSKEPGLKRLLEAGGGRLIATKLPFTDDVIQMVRAGEIGPFLS